MWERGITNLTFQSPRSGQICSNVMNQSESYLVSAQRRFNPLDRVKFVQIYRGGTMKTKFMFQSPRSGQICSNMSELIKNLKLHEGFRFQSPRSGQICSNLAAARKSAQETAEKFQSPRSGQICSNRFATFY